MAVPDDVTRTFGPYHVGAQNDCVYIIDKPPRPSNDDVNPDGDTKVVAKVYLGPNDVELGRLFAAAPDLLAACEELARLPGGDTGIADYEELAIRIRPMIRKARRAFTLIELMVVMVIILLISVVALPTIVASYSHRQVSEAGRIVQGALIGARDNAIRNNRPSGIRLLPDPAFGGIGAATIVDANGQSKPNPYSGILDPTQILACNRIVPLDPAPEYSEGAVSVFPATVYAASVLLVNGFIGCPALVIEETAYDLRGMPLPPNSWAWNIRVGDKLQVNQAGPWYTVVGPVVVANPELFVNYGQPGVASPLQRKNAAGTNFNPEYLLLVNGKDDNGNGWTDEGFDGVDNNQINGNDELIEWESEQWLGSIGHSGVSNLPYTIQRRPAPSTNAREVALPTNVVVDLTTWGTTLERSRVGAALNRTTGYVDIMVQPDGTVIPTTIYSSPSSVGLAGAFIHLWLSERGDLATSPVPSPLTPPRGEWSLVTIFGKSGNVIVNAEPDPANPFAKAQQGNY